MSVSTKTNPKICLKKIVKTRRPLILTQCHVICVRETHTENIIMVIRYFNPFRLTRSLNTRQEERVNVEVTGFKTTSRLIYLLIREFYSQMYRVGYLCKEHLMNKCDCQLDECFVMFHALFYFRIICIR